MNSSRLAAAAALFVSLSVPAMVACGGADDDVTARPARRSTRTKAASERLGQSGAWKLPANVKAAGLSQHVSYDSPPSWNGGANCSKKFTDGAKILKAHVSETYSGVASIGGYACRQNTANKAETSVHGTGRALDIMIPKSGSGADNGVGDPIANWLVTNAQSIGVQLIIWDGTKWNASSGGAKDKPYTGPNPHTDHIHVELSNEGANASTPWFADKKDATGEDSAANDTPSGGSSTGSKNTGSGSSTGSKNTGSGSSTGSKNTGSGSAGGAGGAGAGEDENGGSAGSSGDETDEENGGSAGTSGDDETDPTDEENGGSAGSSDEETTEDGEQNQEENAVDDDAPASQACGDVTEQGSCDGNKVSFCDGGELIASDCANGNSCGSSDGYASCTDGEESSNNEDSSSNNEEQTNEESSSETEDNTASNEEPSNEEPSNEEPSNDSSGDDWQQDI
jgi:hypothetical protein